MHEYTSPFHGFHLGTGSSKLTRESPFYQDPLLADDIHRGLAETASTQFQLWCESFRNLVRNSESKTMLRIRFVVADATALCVGLNQLHSRKAGTTVNCYSRPWSAQSLQFGEDYLPECQQRAPISFNVIDTSSLSDHIGFLNLVPHVVPLLHPTISVLYTTTQVSSLKEERNLLDSMLGSEAAGMCVLFGIVPTAYLSGVTTLGYVQDKPNKVGKEPITNRITWRLATSIDPKLNLAAAKPTCSEMELANLFYPILWKISTDGSSNQDLATLLRFTNPWRYTQKSFFDLLKFVESRIHFNIDKFMGSLLELSSRESTHA